MLRKGEEFSLGRLSLRLLLDVQVKVTHQWLNPYTWSSGDRSKVKICIWDITTLKSSRDAGGQAATEEEQTKRWRKSQDRVMS